MEWQVFFSLILSFVAAIVILLITIFQQGGHLKFWRKQATRNFDAWKIASEGLFENDRVKRLDILNKSLEIIKLND